MRQLFFVILLLFGLGGPVQAGPSDADIRAGEPRLTMDLQAAAAEAALPEDADSRDTPEPLLGAEPVRTPARARPGLRRPPFLHDPFDPGRAGSIDVPPPRPR
ncbi:MAG: hypothetical protein K1X35_03285 [Caulobacteraceae bacterium]|nr:hypothetical protein [Caulobacteraceae bacterium]